MKKIENTPLMEVVFMLALCMIATEWVLYPQFHQNQIYFALGLGVVGAAVANFLVMKKFFSFFIIATVATILTPITWRMINGGWDEFNKIWQYRNIPFVEIPITTYLVLGIILFFVLYTVKRIPAIIKK